MINEEEIEDEESESDKRYMKSPDAKSVKGFIEGLKLLANYMEEGYAEKFFCGAEHDVIYIYTENGAPDEESEDGLRLSELGFHRDPEVESWGCFT